MENIMVVFSSTDIPDQLVEKALKLAGEKKAKLIILDIRDKAMSEKVADLTENIGFMGEKVVGALRKEISHGRCEVIYRKLSFLEERAQKEKIPYEIVVKKGSFGRRIGEVAESKDVKTIICQKSDRIPENGYMIIRI